MNVRTRHIRRGEKKMSESTWGKKRSVMQAAVFLAVLFLGGWGKPLLAGDHKVVLNDLIRETQKMSDKSGEMTLIWWIPEEFWRISIAQGNPNATEAQTEMFLEVLRPYTVLVVVDGKMGQFGGVTYTSETDIRAGLKIQDGQGASYLPIKEEKVNPDTKNLLAMMKPIFSNMLGPMGQNMHFYAFSATDREGKRIADARKEGNFSVTLTGREYKWRLPLGSLLPPRICPVDGETLNGAYKYCPWHGAKL
jgi:hypothetical protein